MARILHVSEAYGGGVVTSIRAFVRNSSEHQHYLLATQRENEKITTIDEPAFVATYGLPKGLRQASRKILKVYHELLPDFVHLHSSFAGVYGRLAGIPRSKIIYSPHGFAFEQTNIPFFSKFIYRTIESVAAINTGRFATVSLNEGIEASKFLGSSEIYTIPNTWSEEDIDKFRSLHESYSNDSSASIKTIVFVGRLAPQKDPNFLIRVLESHPDLSDRFNLRWLGGGDDFIQKELESKGVVVSGWVGHQEVLHALSQADLYVHTAAWEGFPMSVIEASAIGVPILLRSIRAFEGYSFPQAALFDSPSKLADLLERFSNRDEKDVLMAADGCSKAVSEVCCPESQRYMLNKLYAMNDK